MCNDEAEHEFARLPDTFSVASTVEFSTSTLPLSLAPSDNPVAPDSSLVRGQFTVKVNTSNI
jgi:hypothetical protein